MVPANTETFYGVRFDPDGDMRIRRAEWMSDAQWARSIQEIQQLWDILWSDWEAGA